MPPRQEQGRGQLQETGQGKGSPGDHPGEPGSPVPGQGGSEVDLGHFHFRQVKQGDQIVEERRLFTPGLHQGEGHFRPGQFQDQAGKAGAAAQVGQGGGPAQKGQDGQGIQKVFNNNVPVGLQSGEVDPLIPALQFLQVEEELFQGGG